MARKQSRVFVLVAGSKQFFSCKRLKTGRKSKTRRRISIDQFLEQKVYHEEDPKCQKCGVCKAYQMKIEAPAPNVVPITAARVKKEVKPPEHNRLPRRRVIKAVAGGRG